MKQSLILSVCVTALCFLLPLLFSPSQKQAENVSPVEAAQLMEEAGSDSADMEPVTDNSILLAVQTPEGIQEMTVSDYLPLALAAEMPASFEMEALKAQAVALRSYALHYRAQRKTAHPQADICSEPGCCAAMATAEELQTRWDGKYDRYLSRMTEAVQATDGQYLVWEDQPALAVFHASSRGVTEDGAALGTSLPYLVSVSTPETPDAVSNLCTTVEVSASDFSDTVRRSVPEAVLPENDPAAWVGAVSLNAAGRVSQAQVGGVSISGLALRQMFALRSTDFTLAWDGEEQKFVFRVNGYGHGMGMSQYGANLMAKSGADCAEILAHYYPGTELVMAMLEVLPENLDVT